MLTALVALLGIAAVVWLLCTQVWMDDLLAETVVGKLIATVMLAIFGALLAGVLTAGVGALCYAFNQSGGRTEHQWSLQQIAHDQGIHGRFYLGSGYIDSQQEFVAYYKSDGGYRLGQFPADQTLVIEKDGPPTLYEYDTYVSRWLIPHFVQAYRTKYVIVVPKGSIAPAVNLNLGGAS